MKKDFLKNEKRQPITYRLSLSHARIRHPNAAPPSVQSDGFVPAPVCYCRLTNRAVPLGPVGNSSDGPFQLRSFRGLVRRRQARVAAQPLLCPARLPPLPTGVEPKSVAGSTMSCVSEYASWRARLPRRGAADDFSGLVGFLLCEGPHRHPR